MADVALRPTFPSDELDRLRQQRLTAILQARDDPATIAPLAFCARAVRHRHTATAPPTAGTAERSRHSPSTICARSTRRRSGPTTLRFSSSATSTADTVLPLLETSFGSLEAPAAGGTRRRRCRPCNSRRRARSIWSTSRARRSRRSASVDRRAAVDARLLPASGAEHDPRRLVLVASEHEPAREARLRLRRRFGIRHAHRPRPVRRRSRRADRQDRPRR